ncbi:MAG: SdrD B-like domain-containing protein, partial [Thermoguttaceae bacterium]|nr:SdrD B-like domain-containing protein [Thermoguttaceae bacterium]
MKTRQYSTPGFADRFWNRTATQPRRPHRRLAMEPLESRHLLSVTLNPIGDQSVLAGAPLNLALSATSSAGNPLDYTVDLSNANLSAEVPVGNPSLRIDVAGSGIDGYMVLQLFEDLTPETVGQIVGLANNRFYDGLIFHRVMDGFMIQGGCPDGDGFGGPGFEFDDEFHPSLQFTGPGLLAMANEMAPDTNGSQFFITAGPTRWLDFQHTIFGLLTEGDDVRQQINDVATDPDTDKPLDDVVMTGVTVFYDTQNGVLRLSAPQGTTGTTFVTVTATDSVTGQWASETFEVVIGPDTSVPPPFLASIDPIVTTVDMPVDFQIPGIDVQGNPMYFDGIVEPEHPNLAFSVNNETGEATLTPTGGAVGVFSVLVGVTTEWPSRFDTQMVPVYIHPAAPIAVELLSGSFSGETLEFQIDGVVPGAEIELLADGTVVGQATAAGSSVIVTTTLGVGTYQITARQTLKDQAVEVGNLETTVDLPSALSAPLTVDVEASASVSGVKYLDIGDGITVDSRPLGGFTIQLYLDDGDGLFDPENDSLHATAVTDPVTGEYTFSNLEDGVYFIVELVEDGWTQTVPVGYYTVEVVDQTVSPEDSFDFANYRELPSVSGLKWHDILADGITGDDVALGGFTIELYLDNGDDEFDPAVDFLYATAVTDAVTGKYTFSHLLNGRYYIREVAQPGWTRTYPVYYHTFDVIDYEVAVADGYDFANHWPLPSVSGVKYLDFGNDGITGDDIPLGGFTIKLYLDNGDGEFDPDEDALYATAVTDAVTGGYTFGSLINGLYFIVEVVEDGWTQTVPEEHYTFEVVDYAVEVADGYDFANYRPLPSVGGVKWHDITGDGITGDDVPLGGFTIELYLDNGDGEFDPGVDMLYATAVTDAETGGYTFGNLINGRYYIREVTEPGWVPIFPDEYHTFVVVDYAVEDENGGYDFANHRPLPSLGGTTYHDITGNGITADDIPLGGFTVELYRDNGDKVFDPSADELIGSQVTDSVTGQYSFEELIDGRYYVRMLPPAGGWTQSYPPYFHTVIVTDQTVPLGDGYHFGVYRDLPSLGGVKYHDLTGDGITDDDLPLGGFTIELYLDDGDGVFDPSVDAIYATATTDAVTGEYTFTHLINGRYFIREATTPGWASTAPSDPEYYTVEVTGYTLAVASGYDFANYRLPPVLSGVTYRDVTGDGITGDDVPYGWFIVELYRDDGDGEFDPGADELLGVRTTDPATGQYAFDLGEFADPDTNSADGCYFIRIVVQDGWTHTDPSDPAYYTIDVLNHLVDAKDGYDFASYLQPPTLSGVKYRDVTGDGLTSDDVPLGGFTIELYLDDGDGIFDRDVDTLLGTRVTDAVTGEYMFDLSEFVDETNSADGRYFIREVAQPSWTQTDPFAPLYYTIDVVDHWVEFTSGYDFANVPPPPSISGVKYHDITGDGVTDDDVPLGGHTIELYLDDGDGVFNPDLDWLIEAQVTDAATGAYMFSNLDDGRYFVREVADPAWMQTAPLSPLYYTVDVAGGWLEITDGYDFANHPAPPSLSGVKYRDITGDGITSDDVPLGGFTIELYLDNGNGTFDPNTDTLLATRVTAAGTGQYTFDLSDFINPDTNSADGRYFIREVTMPDWTPTGPLYYTIDVVNHVVDAVDGYDFANYVKLSSLSGFVYVDINNDGIKQSTESVIANAVVWLSGVDNLGNVIDPVSTTTDVTGAYKFSNLLPGTYTITQDQPPAFVDGKNTIGTPGGNASVPNVFSNIVLPANFHGKNNNFGEYGLIPELYSSRVLIFPPLPDDVLDANTGEWIDAGNGGAVPDDSAYVVYDLIGRITSNGDWWLGESNAFDAFTNSKVNRWNPNLEWVDVMVGDFTGNGVDDIVGRIVTTGDWWVAVNNGDGTFTNQKWGKWNPNLEWVDVMVADFTGDGVADIAGRIATTGDWWVAASTGTGFTNAKWTRWNPSLELVDVMAADFTGDGVADIAGRIATTGDWWVATSTGTGFTN